MDSDTEGLHFAKTEKLFFFYSSTKSENTVRETIHKDKKQWLTLSKTRAALQY